ncbi:MAG TPA: hypothetical protein VFW64_07970 [Pseudonocardiaceae bacterium]|nr:hypothetical protein [Pseudonocardiaceae bacterium]
MARFLAQRLEPAWRPDEWNPDTLIFTGDPDNPKTFSSICAPTPNAGTQRSPEHEFAAQGLPLIRSHEFTLAGCSATVAGTIR